MRWSLVGLGITLMLGIGSPSRGEGPGEADPERALAEAPSFLREVEPVLTRYGCNQGACHGKLAGQNGFRLSLRGYAPEWDHEWLTREFSGRRVNRAVPEESLLLRKPTGDIPHEGGRLFGEDEAAHDLLRRWIEAGMPGPIEDEPTIDRIELSPGDQVVRAGDSVPLTVRALDSDGEWSDVTWLSRFASNDESIARVSPEGVVTVARAGATSVRAGFLGQVAVVTLTVPYEEQVDPARFADRVNVVDEHVFDMLERLNIEPSGPSPDAAFLRRASLDLIGLPPTPEEVRAFLDDDDPEKRLRVIDGLLDRAEFVDVWTLFLADLLQNRKERDHDVRGTKGVRAFHAWLRGKVEANTPWDALAREVLTARGSTLEEPAVGYSVVTIGTERQADRSEIVDSAAQAFLGVRIGCAKCHNHPLERYSQDDYYHFAAFFSRVGLDRKNPADGPTTLSVGPRDDSQKEGPVGVHQPRTGAFLPPQTLDREPIDPPLGPDDDPRAALADWMTSPDNRVFAGAMVNRVWAQLMGVGLVEPIDDLRDSNPPSNPALWDALVDHFIDSGYDMKALIRLIAASRAYGLDSSTTGGNALDDRFYSHAYARRLPAEVALDAICRATGVPEHFPGYPVGLRAVQVPDPSSSSDFLGLFGRSERVTACACERLGDVTLTQLLHLRNGEVVQGKIRAPEGRLSGLIESGADDPTIVEELFLATFARPPSDRERAAVLPEIEAADDRFEALADLFWALLNAKEFTFTH